MKQGFGLEQKQTQKLSPLQIQTIKLIEQPILELEQRIKNELDENPVLDDSATERGEEDGEARDISLDELKDDGSIPSYRLKVNNWGKDERPEYNTFSVKESFAQTLLNQLGFCHLNDRQMTVGRFLIYSLDDDGYLHRDLDSIVDDIAFKYALETDYEEVSYVLGTIQNFDPAGVGARDLRECLLLQLKRMKKTPETLLAARIVAECFDDLISKHFQRIMNRFSLSKDELRPAVEKISRLNPAPGGQFDDSYNDRAHQVVPDFRLTYDDGEFQLTMPRAYVPEIRVKPVYAEMLEDSKNASSRVQKDTATFIKQKIDSAKWFVEAIKQRNNTLESTMKAILDFQRSYFTEGEEKELKPMVLKDIARITGFDISTISRVVNSKYIETHFGIFPLKFFFSEGLENQSGEEVSTRELKKILSECIEREDKSKPLTDDQLVAEFTSRGYKVARRTIAKYRDQLGIPKARMRKEI